MNKEKLTKEYFEKLHSLRLSETSRARMQEELLTYARFHAVPEDVRITNENRSIPVPVGTSFITKLYTLKITRMTAFILIALLVSGGTSFAAESSIPGDILYPIKVDVNENIRSAFALSDKSEATLQTHLAEERLEEASLLAEQGALDADVSTEISTRLAKHYNKAREHSDRSETEGDIETSATVRASLEGSFRTYADILSRLNEEKESNRGTSLVSEIRGYADASAKAQATATIKASDDLKKNVEATLNRASKFIRNAEATLARMKTKLSAETYARFETHFNAAVSARADAETQFEAGQYQNAYENAQTAIRIAQEIETTIQSVTHSETEVEVETEDILEDIIDLRIKARVDHEKRSNDDALDDSDEDDDTQDDDDDDRSDGSTDSNDDNDDNKSDSDSDDDDETTIRIKSSTSVDTDLIKTDDNEEDDDDVSADTRISL